MASAGRSQHGALHEQRGLWDCLYLAICCMERSGPLYVREPWLSPVPGKVFTRAHGAVVGHFKIYLPLCVWKEGFTNDRFKGGKRNIRRNVASVLRSPFVCVLVQLACYFEFLLHQYSTARWRKHWWSSGWDSFLECVPMQAALITGLSCTGGPAMSQCAFCGLSKRRGQSFNFLPDCMWQWKTYQYSYFSCIFGLWLQISKISG